MYNDRITQFVGAVVISRGPCTRSEFETAVGFAAAEVAQRWELSVAGADQAVRPILSKLMPPTVDSPKIQRRPRVENPYVQEYIHVNSHVTRDMNAACMDQGGAE